MGIPQESWATGGTRRATPSSASRMQQSSGHPFHVSITDLIYRRPESLQAHPTETF